MCNYDVRWMRSSFCADSSCVEVAAFDGEVLVRDGKNSAGPVLEFSTSDWGEFLDAVIAGEFNFG